MTPTLGIRHAGRPDDHIRMDQPTPTPREPNLDADRAQLETLLALKESMQQLHAQLEYLRLMIRLKSPSS